MHVKQDASFPPPPRFVRRRASASHWGGRVTAFALLLAALGFAGFWCRDALVHFAGEPVSAHVTRKYTTQGRRSTNYHIAYRYPVGDASFMEEDSVRRAPYTAISSRSHVPAQTFAIMGYRTASLMLGRGA